MKTPSHFFRWGKGSTLYSHSQFSSQHINFYIPFSLIPLHTGPIAITLSTQAPSRKGSACMIKLDVQTRCAIVLPMLLLKCINNSWVAQMDSSFKAAFLKGRTVSHLSTVRLSRCGQLLQSLISHNKFKPQGFLDEEMLWCIRHW